MAGRLSQCNVAFVTQLKTSAHLGFSGRYSRLDLNLFSICEFKGPPPPRHE